MGRKSHTLAAKTSRRRVLKATVWAAPMCLGAGSLGFLTGCSERRSAVSRDILELGVRDAVARIRTGDMRAEDYVSHLIAHARAHQELNAIVTLDETRVLEEARAVDKARASGAALGPLAGLPFVVKDQIDVAGYPTTVGHIAMKAYVAKRSATVVEAVTTAGGIVFAKTNLPQMIGRGGGNTMAGIASANPYFGHVRNPYDPRCIPGGSSGGNGAAIGARFVPAGIGEDTGGSVRLPAALCGLAGLRPSTYTTENFLAGTRRKRYSDQGIVPPAGLRETFGPMARSVADCAVLDEVITGERVPAVTLKDIRIGIPIPEYWDDGRIDQEVAKLLQAAFVKLRDAGATLVEIDVASIVNLNAENRLTRALRDRGSPSAEEWLAANLPGVTLDQLSTAAESGPSRQAGAEPEASVDERRRIIADAERYYASVFQSNGLTAFALPMVPVTAHPKNPNGESADQTIEINGKQVNEIEAVTMNIYWSSRIGAPGLTIPAGLVGGMPVGLGLEAMPGNDSQLLGLGIAVENLLGPIPPPALLSA